MSAVSHVYGEAPNHLATGDVDWTGDTIKVALVTSAYTPSQSGDDAWDDVKTHEVSSGNGYTSGGATLTSKTVTTSGLVTSFDAGDVTWTPGANETLSARYAVVYKDGATAADSFLLTYVLLDDSPADVSSTNADFKIQWDASGVFKATAQ